MSVEAASLPRASIVPAAVRPILLLVGVAAAIAAGVAVVLWSQGPTYSMLYGELGPQDQVQIVQALESAGIPHKLDPVSGAVTVPSDRVHDARLKLAGQGLPEGDGGFNMIAKDPGFGVSQFMENARYQHALETELAKTISDLQAVGGARVHLALPRQSAFVRDRRAPSASVLLQLKPGRRLESEQITAIVNLVASSIPELEANQVTVIDQQGHLLSSPEGHDEFAARDKQMEIAQHMEETYTQRIVSLLEPLVGAGHVRAQVVADVEMSSTEEAREQYKPDSQIVRSEQSAEETSRNGAGGGGVPGSLTNQPPQPGVAQPPGSSAGAQTTVAQGATPAAKPGETTAVATTPDNTSKQSTRNYEIDRTVAYTKQPAGRLKRLTVAVLVDNLRSEDEEGNAKETPLPPEQIENMTKLVKDAVGFNTDRGDSVNVVNSSFQGIPKLEDAEPINTPWWERPLVRDAAKLGGGLVVALLLIFMVLRPLARGLLNQSQEHLAALPMPESRVLEHANAQAEPMGYEQQVTQARTLVNQDPALVAQVVKTWVGKDE
jgi:flagellar M-ring protein FliF